MTIDVAGFEQTAAPPAVPLAAAKSPAVVAIGVVSLPTVGPASQPPTPVAFDRQLPIGVASDAAGLAGERAERIAEDAHLQAEIDALTVGAQFQINNVIDRQNDADAERLAAEAAINQALADEAAARAAGLAAEAQARTDLSTATTQALGQASADIQSARDDAAAALASAETALNGAIAATAADLQNAIDAVQASSDGVLAQLNTEVFARESADAAEVTARTTAIAGVQSDIGTVASALTTESQTRATNDAAETSARQAAVAAVQGDVDTVSAGLANEINVRATADAAETSARQTQISQVQNDIAATNAAITNEANTRAAADAAETSQRQAAISQVQQGLDSANAAITAEAQTRATADTAETNARQAAVSAVQQGVNDNAAAITAEANTRATNDSAETSERKAAVSAVSAKGSPKRIWSQSTAPTFDQIFPPGVQACPLGNLDNPSPFGAGIGTWTNTARTITRGIDLAGWTLEGDHTVYAFLNGAWAAQSTYECFDINEFGSAYGIVEGATYEVSAYVGAHRGRVFLIVGWIDASGNWVAASDSIATSVNDWSEAGGTVLSGYKRLYLRSTAPAGAVRMYPSIRCDNQGADNKAGQASPYVFVTRPQFARVPTGAPAPIDWQPFDAPVWINTGDSNKAHRWSGIYGATWVEQSDLRISANAAAITNEANTRASADATETSQRQAAISAVQTDIASNLAAINSEASTRATADAAETSARQSAVSGLQNGLNDVNAAIVAEQNTRAAADLAETTARQQQVSQISTPGGALTDPLFTRSTLGSGNIPWGWANWSYGTTVCSIVAGRISDKCLLVSDPGTLGPNTGIYMADGSSEVWSGASLKTNRYFVVEVDFEFLSGNPNGSGLLIYGTDHDANVTTTWSWFQFKDVTGATPQVGKIYSLRRFFDGYNQHVPANPGNTESIFHLFSGWDTIYVDQAASPVAKTFKVHRINIRAATQPEIDAGTAGGVIGAAITNEANTRASQIAAETSQRQSDVSQIQNGLNEANAAIVTERDTRASEIASAASARMTLSSSLSAQINPKRTFSTATQPTFDEMFPVNVQACPLGNLKPSDGLNGIGFWTNTARSVADNGFSSNGAWNITGEASVYCHMTGAWADSNSAYEVFDINQFGQCFNVVAGRRYEFSAYTGAHRGRALIIGAFYDDNWNILLDFDSMGSGALYWFGGVNAHEKNGGNSLSDWKRLGLIAQAPAGATRVVFHVRTDNVGFAGQSDPYCFVSRPYFGRARNDQTTLTDWQPFQPALWLKTSEGNKPYLWSGIYGVGFVAADDTRLTSHSTSISQLMSTTDGLKAMWGVQINTDGKVIGRVKLDGSNGTSSFDVLADSFTVSAPGIDNPIFSTGVVNGQTKIVMRADVIEDNSISQNAYVGVVNTAAHAISATVSNIALKAGDRVLLMGDYIGGDQIFSPSSWTGVATMYVNGSQIDTLSLGTVLDGNSVARIQPISVKTPYTVPADGTYTFVFYLNAGASDTVNKRVALTLISLRK